MPHAAFFSFVRSFVRNRSQSYCCSLTQVEKLRSQALHDQQEAVLKQSIEGNAAALAHQE